MRKESLLYWLFIIVLISGILLTVRYIVNHTRIYVNYESNINPTVINWEMESDSTIRIKEPMYLSKEYYLIDYPNDEFLIEDTVLYRELYNNNINNGSILNVKKPYNIWKSQYNDTIHVFKNRKHLKFVYHYTFSK